MFEVKSFLDGGDQRSRLISERIAHVPTIFAPMASQFRKERRSRSTSRCFAYRESSRIRTFTPTAWIWSSNSISERWALRKFASPPSLGLPEYCVLQKECQE